jgi:ribosome recycling factor
MPYNIRQLEQEMGRVIDKLREELGKLRTGRANASLVESITVSYYGTPTPLKQMASISVPESSMVQIQPWDKSSLGEIEKAVRDSGKGLNATNDGNSVRVTLPPLTEERRQDLIKMVHAQAEETRVALRNLRHRQWEEVLANVKAGQATEDDKYRGEKDLNDLIGKFNKQIEELVANKEKDIKTI